MATQTSVRDYCTLLAKSRLLAAEEIETAYRQWKDETRSADDQVESFCKQLIAKRAVTEWQAAMLRRGRADGFFISGYKILDRIGKGQMGGVYKAVHGLGQIVALKILPASKAKDQHILGRFQREARLLTLLDHPNVVRAYQVGESGGINYIAMEFLEGETLDELLTRRKRLPWTEAVRLVHQTLGGLQHLYDRRMIHRDIKPANLMLTPAPGKHEATWSCTVKILDIGLGRELFDEETPEGQIETQLTVEGSVLGTPDYLAPEQAKDARSADIRADLYSVGCVLFHSICGHPPFPDTNIMAQMLKHATEKPPPLASIVPDVPPALQSVLDSLLAKFPDDRFPTPSAAAEALAPFLGTSGAAPSAARMVPGYKEWLETESQMELPKAVATASKPSPPAASAAKPGTAPAPALAATPAPVKESPRPMAVKPAPVPVASTPATAPRPVPVVSAPATALRPVPVATAPATAPRPVPVAPARPPVAPARPPRPMPLDEVDVELVTEPYPAPQASPFAVPLPAPEPEERSLLDFDRRDWIMLAAGGASVLAAVGLGFGLARLVRKKPDDVPAEE